MVLPSLPTAMPLSSGFESVRLSISVWSDAGDGQQYVDRNGDESGGLSELVECQPARAGHGQQAQRAGYEDAWDKHYFSDDKKYAYDG